MVHGKMEGRMEWGKAIKSSVKAERKKKRETGPEKTSHTKTKRSI